MDKKYIHKVVNLGAEPHATLKAKREELKTLLGFEPSLPQTIEWLCRFHDTHKAENKNTP